MHVVDLTTLFLEGAESGVNTYLHEKARALSGRPGVRHSLILPGARTAETRWFDSTVYTVRSPRLPSNPEHRVLFNLPAAGRLLRRLQPSVVEVDGAYLLGRHARRVLGPQVPIVGFYHVHLPTFIARPSASRFSSALARLAEAGAWSYVRHCNRPLDRIVVASADIAQRLRERGFDRVDVVPLGVNVDLFQPPPPRPPAGPTTILYVGRLSLEKEVDVLIDAFKQVSKRGHYTLSVVGGGPYAKRLHRHAGDYAGITFHGKVPYGPELAERYAAADIYCCPSPHETFSLTTLEGLAAGLPVVAADQGGPRDLVRDGIGERVTPGDPAAFAAGIEAVAARLSPELSVRCREHVLARYTWRHTFDRLLEVYARAGADASVLA